MVLEKKNFKALFYALVKMVFPLWTSWDYDVYEFEFVLCQETFM
jgi:hypothetical protein